MRAAARLWILAARTRQRWRRGGLDREALVRTHAAGRTFADIGCMWSVNGRIAFVAEESGATAVTGVDVMQPTTEFQAERERRRSAVRFVHGDVHDPDVIGEVGPHQVVWCSGLLYHAPNPLITLERLRSITTETLILATETMPEIPGVAQACVFYPGLEAADRRVHQSARPHTHALGISSEFDPEQRYGAWWWGISQSALGGMLHASGFEIAEQHGGPLHLTVIAKPR